MKKTNGVSDSALQHGTSMRGARGRGARGGVGRGLLSKPPPLMAHPLPPPMGMRRPLLPSYSPMRPPFPGLRPRMGPPNMPPVPPPFPPRRGLRRGGPRGRGVPPMPPGVGHPRGRGGLMPRPMLPRPPMYHPDELPPPPMPLLPRPGAIGPPPPPPFHVRGRGPRFPIRGSHRGRVRGAFAFKRSNKTGKTKPKDSTSPSGELNKPWVTDAIKNEILKKHKLHAKAKKGGSKEDWEVFREHRNKVTTMLREAKLEYIGSHELNQE